MAALQSDRGKIEKRILFQKLHNTHPRRTINLNEQGQKVKHFLRERTQIIGGELQGIFGAHNIGDSSCPILYLVMLWRAKHPIFYKKSRFPIQLSRNYQNRGPHFSLLRIQTHAVLFLP